jgi:phage terminase small subunit
MQPFVYCRQTTTRMHHKRHLITIEDRTIIESYCTRAYSIIAMQHFAIAVRVYNVAVAKG